GCFAAPRALVELGQPASVGLVRLFRHRADRRVPDADPARQGALLGIRLPVVRVPAGVADPLDGARGPGGGSDLVPAAPRLAPISSAGRSAEGGRPAGAR